jgi:hypothetical protein
MKLELAGLEEALAACITGVRAETAMRRFLVIGEGGLPAEALATRLSIADVGLLICVAALVCA